MASPEVIVVGDFSRPAIPLREVHALAIQHGFQRLMFSESGPDPDEGLRVLCDEVLPRL